MPRSLISALQRWRERGAGNRSRLSDRHLALRRRRGVEQDLQEVRRAGIGGRTQVLDQVELLLGVARPSRDHRAANRARAAVEDESARRQVIRKRVQNDIARAQSGGIKAACCAPGVLVSRFGLVDRSRRREQPPEPLDRIGDETTEGRRRLLPRRQFRLAQDRQACQVRPASRPRAASIAPRC